MGHRGLPHGRVRRPRGAAPQEEGRQGQDRPRAPGGPGRPVRFDRAGYQNIATLACGPAAGFDPGIIRKKLPLLGRPASRSCARTATRHLRVPGRGGPTATAACLECRFHAIPARGRRVGASPGPRCPDRCPPARQGRGLAPFHRVPPGPGKGPPPAGPGAVPPCKSGRGAGLPEKWTQLPAPVLRRRSVPLVGDRVSGPPQGPFRTSQPPGVGGAAGGFHPRGPARRDTARPLLVPTGRSP